jgi:hypothetical protein
VGLRVRFGALLTGLNSPAVIINVADRSKAAPLCVPQMYVYFVSYCFGDTFACVPCCCFVYGKYFPLYQLFPIIQLFICFLRISNQLHYVSF